MTATGERLDRSAILGMIAMGLAVLVIANDFTALSVALPAIEKTFGTDVTTSQWVINGYAMVFGVCIVTGGRLADMFGRHRPWLDRSSNPRTIRHGCRGSDRVLLCRAGGR